jgi:hypothetical protein
MMGAVEAEAGFLTHAFRAAAGRYPVRGTISDALARMDDVLKWLRLAGAAAAVGNEATLAGAAEPALTAGQLRVVELGRSLAAELKDNAEFLCEQFGSIQDGRPVAELVPRAAGWAEPLHRQMCGALECASKCPWKDEAESLAPPLGDGIT